MITQRILAVLSAILLVGAIAIATVAPAGVPLGQVLYLLDEGLTQQLHAFLAGYVAEWSWNWLIVPLLLRPAWLIPAAAGLICAGMALSLANRKPARRSSHRSQ